MQAIAPTAAIPPFNCCPALDGCHCVTNSLAKIFHHAGHPLSEEMLLGLGAGIGFIYWQMRFGTETSIFVGGRGNLKNFYQDVGVRSGVRITEMRTTSAHKAESVLLDALRRQQPVVVGADMGFLPWFDFPVGYHFGGHTFVACGFDGDRTVLGSDMDAKSSGIKKGFYAPIALDQLRKARSSPFKPFPPRNIWLETDFSRFRMPTSREIRACIEQAAGFHLDPPIRNMGVSGIRHAAAQLLQWPTMFRNFALRVNLFNLYIFIEIGGTGGGAFRGMYARFLHEASSFTGMAALAEASESFRESARRFSAIGLLFQDAAMATGLKDKIRAASEEFRRIADLEEKAWSQLVKIVR